jgi:hypothetical protein
MIMSLDILESALKSEPTYVSFEDGTEWVAPLLSFSVLDKHFWELVNHRPVQAMDYGTDSRFLEAV